MSLEIMLTWWELLDLQSPNSGIRIRLHSQKIDNSMKSWYAISSSNESPSHVAMNLITFSLVFGSNASTYCLTRCRKMRPSSSPSDRKVFPIR
mmetsp:Transcript_20055/g.43156  ORF Transcript_20055/g.43156 Transcript_20055/m.43156 type:complete len:93 (+) Transcript_20055:1550-1828(+)